MINHNFVAPSEPCERPAIGARYHIDGQVYEVTGWHEDYARPTWRAPCATCGTPFDVIAMAPLYGQKPLFSRRCAAHKSPGVTVGGRRSRKASKAFKQQIEEAVTQL